MKPARRLVLLDVDSTLIDQEVIDLLAKKAEKGKEVAAVTKRAMEGEIDFEDSLRERVALLKGLPTEALLKVQEEISFTRGAKELISELLKLDHVPALVSGGFIEVISPLAKDLQIKHFRANNLEASNGYLTGKLIGGIIDRAAKARALVDFAKIEGISLENTLAVGDGANDIDMVMAAGIGIAFCAKDSLRSVADEIIDKRDLREVLKIIRS